MKSIPDKHQFVKMNLQGHEVKVWYLIAPAEPEVGFMTPSVESIYVTNLDDSECTGINLSDAEVEKLIDSIMLPEDSDVPDK